MLGSNTRLLNFFSLFFSDFNLLKSLLFFGGEAGSCLLGGNALLLQAICLLLSFLLCLKSCGLLSSDTLLFFLSFFEGSQTFCLFSCKSLSFDTSSFLNLSEPFSFLSSKSSSFLFFSDTCFFDSG